MSGVLDDLMGPKKEPSIAEQFQKDCKLSRTTVGDTDGGSGALADSDRAS